LTRILGLKLPSRLLPQGRLERTSASELLNTIRTPVDAVRADDLGIVYTRSTAKTVAQVTVHAKVVRRAAAEFDMWGRRCCPSVAQKSAPVLRRF
jgi:hypothetical protein